MSTTKILVVGDPIIDRHWYCSPKGLSPEAPIVNWDIEEIVDQPGGAANVVNNLVALNNIYAPGKKIEVSFVSVATPELVKSLPEDFPTKGLIVPRKRPIIKNRIIFRTPHQQILRFDEDNNDPITDIQEQGIINKISSQHFDLAVISDYSHGGITRRVIEAAKKNSNLVLCDPKGKDPSKYIGLVDILTPNLKEFDDLTSGMGSEGLAYKLMNLATTIKGNQESPVNIILKRSSEGCALYQDNQGFSNFLPYRTGRPVLDPTGAGDTFIASLAFMLARKKRLVQAVDASNKMAGISVTYPNCWIPKESECPKEL